MGMNRLLSSAMLADAIPLLGYSQNVDPLKRVCPGGRVPIHKGQYRCHDHSYLFIYTRIIIFPPPFAHLIFGTHPSAPLSLPLSTSLSISRLLSLPLSLSFCVCFSFLLQFHHTYPIHPNHSDLYLSCNINLTPHRFFLSLHLSFFCLISHLRLTFPPNIGH